MPQAAPSVAAAAVVLEPEAAASSERGLYSSRLLGTPNTTTIIKQQQQQQKIFVPCSNEVYDLAHFATKTATVFINNTKQGATMCVWLSPMLLTSWSYGLLVAIA